jgi:hypothetical protein
MKLLVLFCLLTATFVCKAQQIPSPTEIASLPLWAQKMYGENPNVLEVSELYRNFYREHDFEKNYHTQYFKPGPAPDTLKMKIMLSKLFIELA